MLKGWTLALLAGSIAGYCHSDRYKNTLVNQQLTVNKHRAGILLVLNN